MDRLDLAVLESRWWTESNDSVRGVFDMLAGIVAGNPFGYHYEMFNTADSIREIISRVAGSRDIHHIHVAAHGDELAIYGPGNSRISRTVLGNALEGVDARQIYGVFFGSCSFGGNVASLMERTGATWVAGYTEDIDWVHAAAMDLFFWHAYYQSGVPSKARKADRADEMLVLLNALWIRVPYLFKELGFTVSLSNGRGYVVFPDDFFDGNGNPIRDGRELFARILDHINDCIDDGDAGAWPCIDDLDG